MQDMTIAKNLRRIMFDKGITQADLARVLGINKATVSSWMTGTRIPRLSKIDMLATVLNVRREDIVGIDNTDSEPQAVKIRIYGKVAAGVPMAMIDDIYDEEEIPAEMMKGGREYFGLVIHGDSMEPRMHEGDVVIVRKQDDADTGDTVIATVNGDDATCKKLKKERNGIWLLGTNPTFSPVFFSDSEIRSIPVKILGKVVELRAKYE